MVLAPDERLAQDRERAEAMLDAINSALSLIPETDIPRLGPYVISKCQPGESRATSCFLELRDFPELREGVLPVIVIYPGNERLLARMGGFNPFALRRATGIPVDKIQVTNVVNSLNFIMAATAAAASAERTYQRYETAGNQAASEMFLPLEASLRMDTMILFQTIFNSDLPQKFLEDPLGGIVLEHKQTDKLPFHFSWERPALTSRVGTCRRCRS